MKNSNVFSKAKVILAPSVIGEDTVLKGHLKSANSVTIMGVVNGNISADTIFIDKFGVTNGNIEASELVVRGKVTGKINVTGLVRLERSAEVTADINYEHIMVESGAVLNGALKKVVKEV